MTPTLYHYTCDHGRAGIGAAGVIRPHGIPAAGLPRLVWLTDLDAPIRDALGLTSHALHCDRTRHRFRVIDAFDCVPYLGHRSRSALRYLELAPGARPLHWWVSDLPVPVVDNPITPRRHTI